MESENKPNIHTSGQHYNLQLQGVFVMRTRHVGIARVIFIVNIITWGYIYK